MQIRNRLRRAVVVTAATGLAAVSGITTVAGPAAADPTTSIMNNAINGKLSNINVTNGALYQDRFWYLNDADGIWGAQSTPDGYGAYQWYFGLSGARGAIYAHPKWGYIYSQAIYGNILESWIVNNFEHGKGYPMGDEYTATQFDVSQGCPVGTVRAQRFSRLNEVAVRRACWNPNWGGLGVIWTS